MKLSYISELTSSDVEDAAKVADSLNEIIRTINNISSKKLNIEDNIKSSLYTVTIGKSISSSADYIRIPNKYKESPKAVVVAAAKPLIKMSTLGLRDYFPFITWDLDSGNNIVVTHVNLLIDFGTTTVPTEFTLLILY